MTCASLAGGCGATHKRDVFWNDNFIDAGFEAYVVSNLKTPTSGWIKDYNDSLAESPGSEDKRKAARNRVINGYLLIADTAYSRFEQGYNEQIAYFEIGSDMVNLGLTAASAVTPPAALLGAAATGAQGVQKSVEKNGLNSQTRFVIIGRMEAIRERQRNLILKRELEPVSCQASAVSSGPQQTTIVSDICYTLDDAMRDVNEYFNLGTITRALSDISSQTGQLNVQQPVSQAAPAITSENHATFSAAAGRSFMVKATGTPTPSVAATGLPAGVTLNPNGTATWTLTATDATAASPAGAPYTFTITAHNGVSPDAVQSFALTVQP